MFPRRTAVGFAVVLLLCPPGTEVLAAEPPEQPSMCDRVGPGAMAGAIGATELDELSGLAASHAFPGVLWAHNDSGDGARLFAMSDSGASLGTFAVPGAEAIDWEDIATGRGPDPSRSYIYIADIGDNDALRDHVTVYRVPEPDAPPVGVDGTFPGAEALQLVYPGGAEDAEALFIDPLSGDLFIITKQVSGTSRVLTVAAPDLNQNGSAGPLTMSDVGSLVIASAPAADPALALALPSTTVTAADISPDGRVILVRTYQQVLAFDRADGQTVADALSGQPCSAPVVGEVQGEAIAIALTGDRYFTAGETQLAVSLGAIPADAPNPLTSFVIAAPTTPVATTVPAVVSTIEPTTSPTATTTVTLATSTVAPTSAAPTSAAPTSAAPTSAAPSTSVSPSTDSPSGDGPTDASAASASVAPTSTSTARLVPGSLVWASVAAATVVTVAGLLLFVLGRIRRRRS